jgi:hypothetical protein
MIKQPKSNRLISISSSKCDLITKVDEHRVNLRKTMASLYAKELESLELTTAMLYQFILADMGIDFDEIASYRPSIASLRERGKPVVAGKHIIPRKTSITRNKHTPEEYKVTTQWEVKLKDNTVHKIDNPHLLVNIWKGE